MTTPLRIQTLLAELAAIERQLDDPTLPPVDRQRLDDEWDTLMDEWDTLHDPGELLMTICNCDSDGECSYCEELRRDTERMEAEARWNAEADTREGCARCPGCAYCSEGGLYDGADEV
jgi:hypothetical protein